MPTTILIIIFSISAIVLIASVLISSGSDAGLGAAFGGSEQLFGRERPGGFDGFVGKVVKISGITMLLTAFIIAVI